jgi:sugar/nucleoside kinase (ribokinase family)
VSPLTRVDVVVTATAFMDITFIGLESVPRPGEERFAGDLLRSPGGGAINAIGASRLGLRAALAVPLGRDLEGRFIRETLEREGIELAEGVGTRTPTTVVMPWGGERAMVTYEPGVSTSAAQVAAFSPRAAVVALDQLDVVPPGARGYVTCGDDDARAFAGRPPRDLDRARALFVNRREALVLTGADSPEVAAAQLGADVEIVVVTLGPDGALAHTDGEIVRAPGFEMKAVDTTGAGDLLCAAFVWADLAGAEVELALQWAVLYGSLSVTVPTGAAGAVTLERLLEEGAARGLPPLATRKETRT